MNKKKKVNKTMVGMFIHNRHITDPTIKDVNIFKRQCKTKNKSNKNRQIKFKK
jgi:hypothetical protein